MSPIREVPDSGHWMAKHASLSDLNDYLYLKWQPSKTELLIWSQRIGTDTYSQFPQYCRIVRDKNVIFAMKRR
jgi:hypothetical protein